MCYVDADADGARSPDGATVASSDMECDEEGEASGLASVDCADDDASVHPGAEESPADGIDADCDGAELCYTDYDGDGYRPDDYSEVEGDLLCTGAGLVGADAPGGDCDDDDASVNPEGEETAADGIDGNCDGIEQCYVDADNDGYRTMDGAIVDSEAIDCNGDGVAGSDAPDTDCDDTNGAVHPDIGDAIGDELDADCDGFELCYVDADNDGYRTMEVVQSVDSDCEDVGEANADVPLVDCDDTRAGVNPGAEEVAGDGVDQDCDGVDLAGEDDDSADADGGDDEPADSEEEFSVSVEYPPEKSGCSTTPRGAGGFAWLLSLGLIVGYRRENRAE
jgi:MYXO-CTERM domain-containing protein